MTTTVHDQDYDFYSWDELGHDIFLLAKQVLESQIKVDRIIALAKGGLTFSRAFADYLGIKKLSTMQIEFYNDINQTNDTPVITQELPVNIQGEHILVFDDIVDSGETLNFATKYFTDLGAKSIHTATMIEKPWSKFKTDFAVKKTESWVIFPHEIREMVELLRNNWQKKGDSLEKIKQQLIQIGLNKAEVELFLNLK